MNEPTKAHFNAFTSGHYDYRQAINLYDKEIEQSQTNYTAYNNRGLCKIHLGTEPYDAHLIKEGMNDFNKAIELAQNEGVEFESAQHNLALAINLLKF